MGDWKTIRNQFFLLELINYVSSDATIAEVNNTTSPILPFSSLSTYWLLTFDDAECLRPLPSTIVLSMLVITEFFSRLKQNHRHEQICFTSVCVWNCFGMRSFTEVSNVWFLLEKPSVLWRKSTSLQLLIRKCFLFFFLYNIRSKCYKLDKNKSKFG